MVFAVDEKVLVGNNEHQAYIARPVREGDDKVLVRWESTGAREEVAVGDVKKIDLDAKRPRRKRREASGAEAEASAPARREPPRKRRKKKADADDDESSSVDKILSVAEIRAAYQREQKAARAAASDEEDAGAEDPSSAREEIERHVKALRPGDAEGKDAAVEALENLAGLNAANRAAIVEAGGIEALVVLVRSGAVHGGHMAVGQKPAVWALWRLAADHKSDYGDAIVAAGGMEALVEVVRYGAPGGKEAAAHVLRFFIDKKNAANDAAIVSAGGIPSLVALATTDGACLAKGPGWGSGQHDAFCVLKSLAHRTIGYRTAIATALVALVRNGEAGPLKRPCPLKTAALVLRELADDAANRTAIATALVALLKQGPVVQERAAEALKNLAGVNSANQAAIAEAGGVEALVALAMNGSDRCKEKAKWALSKLPVADYASKLLSENASLKRQLAGEEDVVSLCDGEAPLPAKESSALRDAHDKQQTAVLRRVKEEKLDAEGARDRTDRVAAAASAAAATATADAREAAREAAQELEDVHDDFVNPLTLTVIALQTKIDELHALACQVDPVAADAIKSRLN